MQKWAEAILSEGDFVLHSTQTEMTRAKWSRAEMTRNRFLQ